jgi:hypothetical protein
VLGVGFGLGATGLEAMAAHEQDLGGAACVDETRVVVGGLRSIGALPWQR